MHPPKGLGMMHVDPVLPLAPSLIGMLFGRLPIASLIACRTWSFRSELMAMTA